MVETESKPRPKWARYRSNKEHLVIERAGVLEDMGYVLVEFCMPVITIGDGTDSGPIDKRHLMRWRDESKERSSGTLLEPEDYAEKSVLATPIRVRMPDQSLELWWIGEHAYRRLQTG